MSSVNKCLLVGNLGADPEVGFLPSGDPVVNFRIATSTRWKDKGTGELKTETEWHRITCYGKLSEFASEYLKKGRKVYVEGRLKTRKWADKNGVERFTTEVIATQLQALGGQGDNSQNSDTGPSGPDGY